MGQISPTHREEYFRYVAIGINLTVRVTEESKINAVPTQFGRTFSVLRTPTTQSTALGSVDLSVRVKGIDGKVTKAADLLSVDGCK